MNHINQNSSILHKHELQLNIQVRHFNNLKGLSLSEAMHWSKCKIYRHFSSMKKCLILTITSIVFATEISHQYLYILCLIVCLLVCLYPINVKTAEPIGSKLVAGPHLTLGKVYGWSNFQKFAYNKIRFLKILKIHEIFTQREISFQNMSRFDLSLLYTHFFNVKLYF